MFRRIVLLAAVTLVTGTASALATPPAPVSPICVARTQSPAVGLSVTDAVDRTDRVRDYTVASAAMGGTEHVLVMVPPNYDGSGATRYPVLFLLHGHGGGAADWFNHGVEGIVNDPAHPIIVVMPDGGYDGWYSDWYGVDIDGHHGTDGNAAPAWETFHIDELIPWVDATFPTTAVRAGRAIAGLSMGGFGAMSYAARHPDLFAAAGSFSGAVDTRLDWPFGPLATAVAANLPDRQLPDECIWGDPITQDARWQAHNPTDLAANLHGVSLFLASGNGLPGDGDSPNPGASLTEFGVAEMNAAFAQALATAGVPFASDFRDHGVHAWNYWQADLTHFLPQLYAAVGA